MKVVSKEIKQYGQNTPLSPQRILHAGPLTMMYEKGFIRYVSLGDEEILRMMYFALRDHNWDTIPAVLQNEQISIQENHFHVEYTYLHHHQDIHFEWKCQITGNEDGSVRFEIEGEALSSFQKNRAGFCILHPAKLAGKSCDVFHTDNTVTHGHFPHFIDPHQPFKDMVKIEWGTNGATRVNLEMKGDIFEMEDQRNWTDASYKTYCTPLEKGFPVLLTQGEKVHQVLTLWLSNKTDFIPVDHTPTAIQLHLHEQERFPMPLIGLGRSSVVDQLTDAEIDMLLPLGLSHYRVTIQLSDSDWAKKLAIAVKEAEGLATSIELVICFSDKWQEELKAFTEESFDYLKSLTIFHQSHKTTPDFLLEGVVDTLREKYPDTAIGAGTNAYFTELNRDRVDPDQVDFLTYSINPQVHAFDLLSLTETLEAQGNTVASAKQFAKGKPIHINPVTLKPRFNPNATGPEPEPQPDTLPSQVDPRQLSLYGAAWMLGSIKYLTEAGAAAITYFETVGWKGIVQGANPPALPDQFSAEQGQVFPVFSLLQQISPFMMGEMIRIVSSQPLKVAACLLQKDEVHLLLIANYTREEQEVQLQGLQLSGETWILDHTSYPLFRKANMTSTPLVIPAFSIVMEGVVG